VSGASWCAIGDIGRSGFEVRCLSRPSGTDAAEFSAASREIPRPLLSRGSKDGKKADLLL